MIAFGIEVTLLIKLLKVAHPDITQPCYVDNVGALCTYGNIKLYFNLIEQSGSSCGYYHKPSKSVLIVHPDNIETGK